MLKPNLCLDFFHKIAIPVCSLYLCRYRCQRSVCVCVCGEGVRGELTVFLMLSNLDHSVTYGEAVLCKTDMKDLTFTSSFTATRDI